MADQRGAHQCIVNDQSFHDWRNPKIDKQRIMGNLAAPIGTVRLQGVESVTEQASRRFSHQSARERRRTRV
jgi:hypothetical protein